ncbi:MAG: acyl-CoA dehydrogenase [Syntrophales bacterium]|jgi:alkylation response protein AidB-like acyl-CoA dehydrogenase|nr:acyl-CoA dehydrogenase [Syntrophales bacterium]MCK9527706.1 acyl-CoA dehydrogenase [Syntrophales bacterium]MDX9921639.1 acyl-CoA dehydrogenase [Syntrophales bacterium]
MASKWIDERDFAFLLHEVFQIGTELLGRGPFSDHDVDMVNMVLNEAAKLAENEIAPTYPDEVHKKTVEAEFRDGTVFVPEAYHRLWQLYSEGGWMCTSDEYEYGGQQLPAVVSAAAAHMFLSCNQAFVMFPGLTHGAARLLIDFFEHPLKKIIIEKMFTGQWAGTMCLTEPGAGSDVGALTTVAKRNPDGTFSIIGSKSFISAGDHNLTENIIHPVLARIEGDPGGTRGISIFVVPKIRINDDGSLGAPNDVTCGNIESKMGIHGNPTCTLNFGDNGTCVGYLMGEERQGMRIMFHMMNEERQGVGMMGVAMATAAYRHAVEYARERFQGTDIMAGKDPDAPQVPIIRHPDVRRMLLKQKSIVEGIRALAMLCYYTMDKKMVAETEEEKTKWADMGDILIPLVKAYCTDLGMVVNDLAVQTFGGYGYCREYPVEQMMRDQKINTIYEGTNGIQALDLLGRKLPMKKGMVFMNLLGFLQGYIAEAKAVEGLGAEATIVETALNACVTNAMEYSGMLKTNPFVPLLGAYDYMHCLSDVITGALHLKMAVVAMAALETAAGDRDRNFYTGKIESARFFVNRRTALVPARCETIRQDETSAMRIPEEAFIV